MSAWMTAWSWPVNTWAEVRSPFRLAMQKSHGEERDSAGFSHLAVCQGNSLYPLSFLALPCRSHSLGKENLVPGPRHHCTVRKSPWCLVLLTQGAQATRARTRAVMASCAGAGIVALCRGSRQPLQAETAPRHHLVPWCVNGFSPPLVTSHFIFFSFVCLPLSLAIQVIIRRWHCQ